MSRARRWAVGTNVDAELEVAGAIRRGLLSEPISSTYGVVEKSRGPDIAEVREFSVDVPMEFRLQQNYLNPFNPSTVIRYSVPTNGPVTLKVYNVLGEEVATILDGFQQAGTYEAVFDTSEFSSGVYIYQLRTASSYQIRKMMLLK